MAGHASEREMKLRRRVNKERKRLEGLLSRAGMPAEVMELHGPTLDNIAWMKEKLDDTRAAIKTADVAITYDNGGGQKGIRKNPAFEAYESLWKAYVSGLSLIASALPETEARPEPALKPENVLEMLKARRSSA